MNHNHTLPDVLERQLIATAIDNSLVNNNCYLIGFLRKMRKIGKLVFVNLVDTSGDLQLVFSDHLAWEIQKINKESIIGVQGKIVRRKDVNHDQINGQWEMWVNQWVLINAAKNTTPFVIDQEIAANEDTKLKYRYLELRSNLADRIKARSKIINLFRSFLLEKGFIEVETPILGRSTPEGARDYLVPIRTKNNPSGFALPQSPQIYKQLLMIGGLEKYFQIAKTFRDEDLRSDRQPEFTQLDLELSYSNTPAFLQLIEEMFSYVWKHFYGQKLSVPFPQISYQTAIDLYGSDKPDLRFDLKIEDHTSSFKDNQLKIFQPLENHGVVKVIFLPNIVLNKTLINQFIHQAQNLGLKGLLVATKQDNQYEGMLHQLAATWVTNYFHNKKQDGTIILACDQYHIIQPALGQIRLSVAKSFNLINHDQNQFLWVVDWPLFEYDHDQQQWNFAHNPFTQPKDSLTNDLSTIRANAYDLVLNGVELGSGSARIYDAELQAQMFAAIGWNKTAINNKFGWFINAFNYGVPPHQGIGLGLDRLIQLMLKTNSIRDVIAFPKSNRGTDLMQSAPDQFDQAQLAILGLKKLNNT